MGFVCKDQAQNISILICNIFLGDILLLVMFGRLYLKYYKHMKNRIYNNPV